MPLLRFDGIDGCQPAFISATSGVSSDGSRKRGPDAELLTQAIGFSHGLADQGVESRSPPNGATPEHRGRWIYGGTGPTRYRPLGSRHLDTRIDRESRLCVGQAVPRAVDGGGKSLSRRCFLRSTAASTNLVVTQVRGRTE